MSALRPEDEVPGSGEAPYPSEGRKKGVVRDRTVQIRIMLITAVLDGRILPREYEEEHNYPIEINMERWKRWEDLNRTDIEGYIRFIGHRMLGYSEELLTASVSLHDTMKSSVKR